MIVESLASSSYMTAFHVVGDGKSDTHTALVRFDDGNARQAYIKIYTHPVPLINEITGHILATQSGKHVPDRAAVIDVPLSRIPSPKPNWLSKVQRDTLPAWCTSSLYSGSMKLHYKGDTNAVVSELSCHDNSLSIVAFDDWVANQDRNTGNLVRVAEGIYALIDHGQLFGAIDWQRNKINPNSSFKNKLREMLGSHASNHDSKSRIYQYAQSHEPALTASMDELSDWWNWFDKKATAKLRKFLATRAKDEFVKKQNGLMI